MDNGDKEESERERGGLQGKGQELAAPVNSRPLSFEKEIKK